MTTQKKVKPYSAWWCLPFFFQELDGDRPVRAIMLGYHKPSKLGIPCKPDIVLLKQPNIIESIPFPGKDLTRLVAGIIRCSNDPNILKSANIIADMSSYKENIYREFNFNNMDVLDAIQLSQKYGENWRISIETKLSDIRLLKGAFSYSVRKGHNTSVHILVAIGKDIRNGVPIVLFKKSWKNFTDAMWLWDGGKRFLAGLMFLVRYPPKGSRITFLSDHELDAGMRRWVIEFTEQPFISFKSRDSIIDMKEALKIS